MSERHTILVMEDNPENAKVLLEIVGSMNMESRLVTTLEGLRACLESGFKPCGALLDMQVPHEPGARPHEMSGESGITLVQGRWTGEERVPVVVVTAYRTDPDYVWAMHDRNVDAFCAKSNIGGLPDKIVIAMRKAGRETHAECVKRDGAEGARAGSEDDRKEATTGTRDVAANGGTVTLAMLGEAGGRGRTTLRICGEIRLVGDAVFAVLLRAVEARDREPSALLDRFELGFGQDRSMTTRLRAPFRGLVPDGFEVFDGDQRKRFRLNPEIVVEEVEWARLAAHPDPAISGIAKKALKRRGR